MRFGQVNRRNLILLGTAAFTPLAAPAQEAGRVSRLGFLVPVGRDAAVTVAFFDELRANGFVEGQNLSVVPGDFNVPIARIAEVTEAMVKAAPDAIVAGSELQLRSLQLPTRPQRVNTTSVQVSTIQNKAALQRNLGLGGLLAYTGLGPWLGGLDVNGARGRG